jgi:uncharacterized membrane protein YdjX (TVP38/TMEM64 family)
MKPAARVLLGALALLLAGAALWWLHAQGVDLGWIQARQLELGAWREQHPLLAAALFFAAYLLVTALSLPAATVLMLAGGALFGLWQGLLLVSFASSLGATLAMLLARTLLRAALEQRHAAPLAAINQGLAREGGFYLFALRLTPLAPSFVVNAVLGLTRFPAWRFYLISQLGMLPAALVYVNAGRELAQLDSLRGLLSPELILSLTLLGLLPLAARHALQFLRRQRAR